MKLTAVFKTPGCGDCKVTLRAKGFLAAELFWANQDGPLAGWAALAAFPIDPAGNACWQLTGRRAIPSGATHLYARCVAQDLLSAEEVWTEIPAGFRPEPQSTETAVRFLLMSDLHLSSNPGRVLRALRTAELPVLLCGDLTNDGREEQFRLFQRCIETAAPGRLVLPVAGNHDRLIRPEGDAGDHYQAFQQWALERAQALGCRVWQHPSGAYRALWQGVEIFGLQCVAPGRRFGLREGGQTGWLEHCLAESPAGAWRLILCHAPLLAHNPHRQDGPPYFAGDGELQGILDRSQRLLFLSGHTHCSPNLPGGSAEWDPESRRGYLDDGSAVPTELAGEPLMPSDWKDGAAMELSLTEDGVEIRARSIHSGVCYPRGYYRFEGGSVGLTEGQRRKNAESAGRVHPPQPAGGERV